MKKMILTVVVAALAAMPAAATSTAAASSASSVPSVKQCATKWVVTGRKVAVRRPAWNEPPVATQRTRVDHYLYRGDVVRSCVVAIARTDGAPAYRACGKAGHVWRVVKGGQVAQTCLKRA
jgi:hypothetical protein